MVAVVLVDWSDYREEDGDRDDERYFMDTQLFDK